MSSLISWLILSSLPVFFSGSMTALAAQDVDLELSPEILSTLPKASNAGGEGTWGYFPRKIVIGVGRKPGDVAWMNQACEFFKSQMLAIGGVEPESVQCIYLNPDLSKSKVLMSEIASGKYDYYLELKEDSSSRKLQVQKLHRSDSTDYEVVGWNLKLIDPEWKVSVAKLLRNIVRLDVNGRAVKRNLLDMGLPNSKRLVLLDNGSYFDKVTNSQVDFDGAYQIFSEEAPQQKHYLRAALEIAAEIGLGATDYYLHPGTKSNPNAYDWDFNFKNSMTARFKTFEAWRFDDNSFAINRGHAFAGTYYYLIARSNGMNVLESALTALASSSAWEYFAEYHEVVSINDEIVTPFGGAIIGEVFHQVARIFSSGDKTLANQMMAAIFDTPTAFNHWLDGVKWHSGKDEFAKNGFDPGFWSKFDVSMGVTAATGRKSDYTVTGKVGVDAEIINIPMLNQPGQVKTLITDTALAKLVVEGDTNFGKNSQFEFLAKAVFAAYYQKNISLDKNNQEVGYSFFIGPSSEVEFRTNQMRPEQDFFGIIKVLGTTIDLTTYYKGLRVRSTIDVYGDFAMMRSYVLDRYALERGLEGVQSVLSLHGYYYAAGYSVSGQVVADYGPLELGASASFQGFSGINGRSRFYEKVTNNLNLSDSIADLRVWVAYELVKNVKVALQATRTYREGSISGFGSHGSVEDQYLLKVIYSFR